MKILLLNPPTIDQSKYGKYHAVDAFPSVGLSYLYSYLKKYEYNCKIYDFFFDDWEYIQNILEKERADIIGISCLTECRFSAYKLLVLIRKIKKDTIIIFGGHHSTQMCDQLLNSFDIDYIVLGEGETKLLNLIKSIEGQIPLESVSGIAYKKNGKIIKDFDCNNEYIKNLDTLPFPFSEDQLEIFDKYPSFKDVYPLEVKNISHLSFVNKKRKACLIITSRGCPYNCKFCASTTFWGKKYRFRSPKNVVDEIEFYYRKFGFRFFKFADYAFTIFPERSIEICKEIINRNLKIFFTCQTRADAITEDLVKWLKKAGCVSISIGVESGSNKILRDINKRINFDTIIKAFSNFNKHRLPAFPLMMVGNPGETRYSIKKSISLMKIIKPYKVSTTKTMIFPGTELYDLAISQGFINDRYWLTSKPQPYYTFENSLKTLKKWELEIIYYDKKKYILNLLKMFYKSLSLFKIIVWSIKPFKRFKFLSQVHKLMVNKIKKIFSKIYFISQ